MSRGFFGIGIYHTKTAHNVGTLWRTADILGAAFVFTVGRRYTKQSSDVLNSTKRIPCYNYADLIDLLDHLPSDCPLVGVELDDRATMLADFQHPDRACYLLGAEDHGLSPSAIARCHKLVKLPSEQSLNVATTGSIVIYDRITRMK